MKTQFRAEHDRLRAMIDGYVALMGTASPDINEVMQRRRAFTSAFHAHYAAESEEIAKLRTGEPGSAIEVLLDDHAGRRREVMLRHSALIQSWPPKRLAEEWPTYCREIAAEREFYLAFLAWEEQRIHPLLEKQAAGTGKPAG